MLLPLGLPPFNFWPLSFIGIALFFGRTQFSGHEAFSISVPGFTLGYVLTGQLWMFIKQDPDCFFQGGGQAYFAIVLFGLPAILLLTVMIFFPWLKSLLRFSPFSMGSAFLFSVLWLSYEVIYSLLSSTIPPYLLSAYSIIGLPSDSLIPIIGVFGASLFLVLSSSLFSCLLYQLKKKHPHHLPSLSIAFSATLATPLLCSAFTWTKPYDKRHFNYVMQTQEDRQKTFAIIESISPPLPQLMILGSTYTTDKYGSWPNDIKKLDSIKDIAFVSPFSTSRLECPVYFCVFGEGSGCTCKSHHSRQKKHDIHKTNLPIHNPTTARHPAVDAYRIMILSSPRDISPFLIASKVVGSEAVIVYDAPLMTKGIQERLLRIDRARALEVSRPLLRYSSFGLSAQISSTGKIEACYLPESEFITGQITPMMGMTPYMHLGYLAPLAFIALMMVVFLYRRLFLSL